MSKKSLEEQQTSLPDKNFRVSIAEQELIQAHLITHCHDLPPRYHKYVILAQFLILGPLPRNPGSPSLQTGDEEDFKSEDNEKPSPFPLKADPPLAEGWGYTGFT